jgi:hypothetical protein
MAFTPATLELLRDVSIRIDAVDGQLTLLRTDRPLSSADIDVLSSQLEEIRSFYQAPHRKWRVRLPLQPSIFVYTESPVTVWAMSEPFSHVTNGVVFVDPLI